MEKKVFFLIILLLMPFIYSQDIAEGTLNSDILGRLYIKPGNYFTNNNVEIDNPESLGGNLIYYSDNQVLSSSHSV